MSSLSQQVSLQKTIAGTVMVFTVLLEQLAVTLHSHIARLKLA